MLASWALSTSWGTSPLARLLAITDTLSLGPNAKRPVHLDTKYHVSGCVSIFGIKEA